MAAPTMPRTRHPQTPATLSPLESSLGDRVRTFWASFTRRRSRSAVCLGLGSGFGLGLGFGSGLAAGFGFGSGFGAGRGLEVNQFFFGFSSSGGISRMI